MTSRYVELAHMVARLQPSRILEIGTWNGIRAATLCQWGAEYVGFDLFDEATPQTDYDEKNVKPHYRVEDISEFLSGHDVKHELVKGNTRVTLPKYEGEPFDFAFIDGGHSVDTIRSDWEHVRRLMLPGSTVVFDDYYEDMPQDDLDKWGANRIVDELEFTLSASADPVHGGGFTRLAVVQL